MEVVHCSFCKHGNPVDAKFCNACGAALDLQLCEACGAIDKVSATNCHKCGQPFAPRITVADVDDGGPPAAAPPAQPSRAHWKVFVLLALVAAGALLIYPRTTADGEGAMRARTPPAPVPADANVAAPPLAPPERTQEAGEPAPAPTPDTPPPPGATPAAGETESAGTTATPQQPEPAPVPVDTATDEPATDEQSSAAPAAAPHAEADLGAAADPAPTNAPRPPPATAPAGCSPAIDALGLCGEGFR